MIIDSLGNAELYYGINKRIISALEYLKHTDFENIENGKHFINGEKIYALVNDYMTKDKAEVKSESHRKYIDVQYVAKGCELIGYAPLADRVPFKEYDEEKDFLLFDIEPSFFKLNSGMFAILFPDDIHMPGIAGDKPSEVRKIVVKVKV